MLAKIVPKRGRVTAQPGANGDGVSLGWDLLSTIAPHNRTRAGKFEVLIGLAALVMCCLAAIVGQPESRSNSTHSLMKSGGRMQLRPLFLLLMGQKHVFWANLKSTAQVRYTIRFTNSGRDRVGRKDVRPMIRVKSRGNETAEQMLRRL